MNVRERARELLDEARAACPSLGPVDGDRFVTRVEPLLVEGQTVHAADLYLSMACIEADPIALRQLDRRLRAVAPQALAGARSERYAVDDILQDVREKLLVGAHGIGKLAQYSGKGPLAGWLRVTVARAALDRLREHDPTANDRQDIDELARAAPGDAVVDALERRYAPLLRDAVERGLASLPSEDRTLVQLHFVDGLTIDDLGELLGIHRATAARRLARAREHIRDVAREAASKALGVTTTELESLAMALLSRLDVSFGTGTIGSATQEKPEPLPHDGGAPAGEPTDC